MNPAMNGAALRPATAVRWGARGLSLLILSFWGYFIAAHLLGDQGRSSRPLTAHDYLALAMLAGSLLGLAAAWNWECTGAALTLLSVLISAALNGKVLLFPGLLFLLTAGLFLTAWWLSRAPWADTPTTR